MNMVKLTKRIYLLFLAVGVVFLFGCSGEHKTPIDTAADASARESAAKASSPSVTASTAQTPSSKNAEAEQKLAFAKNNINMAKKGILNYSQSVAICRGIIRDYPDTEYEQKAKMLLREVPENLRAQYHLTDAELY